MLNFLNIRGQGVDLDFFINFFSKFEQSLPGEGEVNLGTDINPQNLPEEHDKESYSNNVLIAIRIQEKTLLFLSR